MENVIKFYPTDAAKNPDNVLEQAIGQYKEVLVLGYNTDGSLDARASLDFKIPEILHAIEIFKYLVLSGEFGDCTSFDAGNK